MAKTNPRPVAAVSRREAARQQRAARSRRRAVLYGTGVIVLAAIVAGAIYLNSRGSPAAPGQSVDPATLACPTLQQPILDLYKSLPPSVVARRVKLVATPYSKPLAQPGPEVTVPDEGNAHVSDAVIAYKHIPPASGPHYAEPAPYQFNTQEVPEGNWVHSLEHGAIVLLYQCSSNRTTVIAWDHELPMQGVDAAQIAAFYGKYVDRGPERVP